MGIHGIYKEIGPGQRIALSKLAVEKFEKAGRPLRIAIDVSIWLFQIQASKGGSNPALRTFYYRLLRLISLSIHPVFVFDGPNKPPFKRNKRTGPTVASIPEFLAKQLLKQFGFPIHLAPGEAEAECALLQREGIVDAVLSEDVDTLMFGSVVTIRNWSSESKNGKTPTHVNLYDAAKIKAGESGLDREGMILVALMSGGDYVLEGIPGCGPKTACEAARAGFGADLCKIKRGDAVGYEEWRNRLQHELKTNESKFFKRKHASIGIPHIFPRADILGYYTHPVVSDRARLEQLKRSTKWDQELDFPGLRDFTKDAFDWACLEGAKHFIRSLAPSLLVRQLRLRGETGRIFESEDVVAVQEHEATLVKGLHGKRQHADTDNTPEIRISFTPLELVKINLDSEDPDPELPSSTQNLLAPQDSGEVDLDDEIAAELEDSEDAPRKRGPTKFDPTKPNRVWVLETYVRVGVPLKIQDWEASRQQPLKPVAKHTSRAAPKKIASKRSKTTGDMPQGALLGFAKVTKPGVDRSTQGRARSKEPKDPSRPPSRQGSRAVVDLLTSSPAKPQNNAAVRPPSEVLPPMPRLTSSATKRRQGLMQRSRTLPADLSSELGPSSTPAKAIETLDLSFSSASPSPIKLPSKRTKTQERRSPRAARVTTHKQPAFVSTSKQMTLDAWTSSPSRARQAPPSIEAPIAAPHFLQQSANEMDTLDLTLSSPIVAAAAVPPPNIQRTNTEKAAPRAPLRSITSNTSSFTSSTSSHSSKPTTSKPTTRRTSPRLHRSRSATATTTDTLDLTPSTSPLPPSLLPAPAPRPPSSFRTTQIPPPSPSPRRSPRNHPPSPPPPPAAAWKAHEKKKRHIILRKSVAGMFDFVDAHAEEEEGSAVERSGGGGTSVLRGKERRKWRESAVEVLDLT
ncbi:hypothetical protein EJ04DRAFT_552823 [Polyplosphaeria fusca]|uniref:Flap structure-specific endonuclease n=1 Tax=Polyplosphaeria fusca TaxID=682080 RepID=A0A9P4QZG7_9PLEO|nr:hypothetical protein EJ04DRAFT_552823 [Polyplosphaeria fusca]